MILPSLGFVVVIFGGGLCFAVAESVGFLSPLGEHVFTLENFARIWRDPEVRKAIWFTLMLTFVATGLSAVCGTLLALWLRDLMQRSQLVKTVLQIPLAIPHLAVSLVLLGMLAPSGMLARVFYLFGLIQSPSDFPVFVMDAYGIGIVLAYVVKETPFVALMILTVLVRVGNEFELVAQTLGASKFQRFRFVTLPLITPPLVFSSLLVWVFVYGAFEVPLILGRIFPTMLAVVAQRKFSSTDLFERPEAMALAVLMTTTTMLFVGLYLKFTNRYLDFEKTSVF